MPLMSVQLGETANVTCDLPNANEYHIFWFKHSPGDILRLIWKSDIKLKVDPISEYGEGFSESKWKIEKDEKTTKLSILTVTQEDEGTYHCVIIGWKGVHKSLVPGYKTKNTTLEKKKKTSHPGDSKTLQCSVLSDSDSKTCSEDLSVVWFRTQDGNSHPDVIYIKNSSLPQCEKQEEKSCFYNFPNKIPSNAANYYCAVATCGEIIFGNGTKVEKGKILLSVQDVLLGNNVNYAALNFSGRKAKTGRRSR
uniref:Ig-like domain-containing protein n=1 Tax=Kryptolebias marmoratus TaxID=37003 RepID=A0A3Q3GNF7_KRYMA